MKACAWLLALIAILLGSAQADAQLPGMDIHVHAQLIAETNQPAPGSDATLALAMRLDAGWHGYWQNPGDAGEGLMLRWTLPPGVTAGPPRFPVPDTLMISGFMNYVYEKPHAILIDLKLSPDIPSGTKLPIIADANWLACTDRVCVPQQGRMQLELIAGRGDIATNSRNRFDQWRAALPVPLDRAAHYAVDGTRIEIAVPYPAGAALAQPYFFPLTLNLINHAAPQDMQRIGDWVVIETQLSAQFKLPPGGKINGLLRIGKSGEGLIVNAAPGVIPKAAIANAANSDGAPVAQTLSLMWLIMGAVAGGVLLNIMPCVFPILGLKALALAKSGGSEQAARRDATAYGAGVILSCLALGAAMLALRAGGQEIGWAFQLQEPGVVLLLMLIMVAVTANLAGLFALPAFQRGGMLAQRPGLTGAFWTGALAAAVATPCTGPFMAAALGAALLLPVAQALVLFAALGLGIALPFIAIAYVPALRRGLPRPGPWMVKFRVAMAVPMGLTALALLWLLWRLSGPQGLAVGASSAVLALLILSWQDRRSRQQRGGRWATIALCSLTFAGAFWLLPPASAVRLNDNKGALGATRFSQEKLSLLRQQGKPVFVYFTADWCLTCKVNEAAVLDRNATAQLFKTRGIAVLRGDFTKRDPAIARFIAAQGQAGVPLYLFYPKDKQPVLLPQILTQSAVANATAS
jgi:thiol:disulfide interchange protein/DsbC/DsbD-like thiol-disulfide interchange protein